MDILFRYFWLFALALTGVNACIYQQRLPTLTAGHPERAAGYRRFFIGYSAVSALVWLVMGVGIVFGGVPNVFSYFSPATGNVFVWAWHATIVALWIAGAIWLFFRGGAQFIIDHPGLISGTLTKPMHVQLWYLLCLAGGIAGEGMMWSGVLSPS
jgi:hypothetical protein